MMKRTLIYLLATVVVAACSDDENTVLPGEKLYQMTNGTWSCEDYCQDVFDFNFVKGSKVTFNVNNVTGGSIAQIALYAPGVALGGTNLFSGNAKEIVCYNGGGCDSGTEGVKVTDFGITQTGTYRLTVTRNYNLSCGTDGRYNLSVNSNTNFVFKQQSADNAASAAPDDGEQSCSS